MKILKTYWRKPFIYFGPNDDGLLMEAVIALRKKPFEHKIFSLSEPGLIDFEAAQYVSKWRYDLVIDLWFVLLNFRWISKEQPYVKEKA